MEERILFKITDDDAQFSATHRIGRKLSNEELNQVERYLRYALEDWGNLLGTIIEKFQAEKIIEEN
ncbi:MAG: hypothetical protein GXO85_01495 [Chlorobi bacterium]|nr:hypothetical protein [Chlorobiota bacterium]